MKYQIVRNFENLTDYWNHVSKAPTHGPNSSDAVGAWESIFTETNTYEEALSLAKNGWEKGLKEIKKVNALLKQKIGKAMDKDIVPYYDVVGEIPDVGMFLSGEPEHMISFTSEEGKKRIVKIVCNITYSFRIDNSVIIRRGAAICALIDFLEKQNVRCEVYAVLGISDTSYSESFYEAFISIKKADEPLNMDRIVFMLAHPSSLRRIGFRALELESKEIRTKLRCYEGKGYGSCSHPIAQDKLGDIYFPQIIYADPKYSTIENTEKEIIRLLKSVGIEIKED